MTAIVFYYTYIYIKGYNKQKEQNTLKNTSTGCQDPKALITFRGSTIQACHFDACGLTKLTVSHAITSTRLVVASLPRKCSKQPYNTTLSKWFLWGSASEPTYSYLWTNDDSSVPVWFRSVFMLLLLLITRFLGGCPTIADLVSLAKTSCISCNL